MSTIYQLITSVQLGGAENVAFELAEHCGKKVEGNPQVVVAELYKSRNDYAYTKKKELKSKNIKVVTLHNGNKRMSLLFAPFRLTYLIVKNKPLIIHSHTDLPDFVLAVAIRFTRLLRIEMPQIVRTIHNTQLWRSHERVGRFTESAYSNESIVSVSLYAMKAYKQLRKKNRQPISSDRQNIYNGCIVPDEKPHLFHIDDKKINIAFCGRFEDYKGVETLISAIPEIEHKFPNRFKFHLIGDGSYKNQLLKLASHNSNIHLYDPVPNVASMLYAFDYLWMPSHFEGLALISIEASFAGVPVIASFAPGLDETLPENWPLKFHLNNTEELYSIFDKIESDLFERDDLKKTAFDFVNKNFSQTKMLDAYSALYNQII